eukprot:gene11416-17789_t
MTSHAKPSERDAGKKNPMEITAMPDMNSKGSQQELLEYYRNRGAKLRMDAEDFHNKNQQLREQLQSLQTAKLTLIKETDAGRGDMETSVKQFEALLEKYERSKRHTDTTAELVEHTIERNQRSDVEQEEERRTILKSTASPAENGRKTHQVSS